MIGVPLTGGCNCRAVQFEVTAPARQCELLPLQALPASQRHSGVGERPPGGGKFSDRRRRGPGLHSDNPVTRRFASRVALARAVEPAERATSARQG